MLSFEFKTHLLPLSFVRWTFHNGVLFFTSALILSRMALISSLFHSSASDEFKLVSYLLEPC